jgi:hypothetical protein
VGSVRSLHTEHLRDGHNLCCLSSEPTRRCPKRKNLCVIPSITSPAYIKSQPSHTEKDEGDLVGVLEEDHSGELEGEGLEGEKDSEKDKEKSEAENPEKSKSDDEEVSDEELNKLLDSPPTPGEYFTRGLDVKLEQREEKRTRKRLKKEKKRMDARCKWRESGETNKAGFAGGSKLPQFKDGRSHVRRLPRVFHLEDLLEGRVPPIQNCKEGFPLGTPLFGCSKVMPRPGARFGIRSLLWHLEAPGSVLLDGEVRPEADVPSEEIFRQKEQTSNKKIRPHAWGKPKGP